MSSSLPPFANAAMRSGSAPEERRHLIHLQPFGNDVCESWHEADARASAPIHEEALRALRSLETEGKMILLSAPRAGHGKTHLLGRVAAKLQPHSVVAALPWETRQGLNWQATVEGILQDLATSAHQGAEGQSLLLEICQGVLAHLLKPLVQSGRVPCANPSQVLYWLHQQPRALFSRQGEARAMAEWFQVHFATLRPSLAVSTGLLPSPWVEPWLQRLMLAASQAKNAKETLAILLHGNSSQQPHAAHEQVAKNEEILLRLMAIWKPMVLVADHMDGLYRDAEAGMVIARMALALTSIPKVRVVLSMNQDLWETTLGRQLPSAMQDRLNASNIALKGLDLHEAKALILLRLRAAQISAEESRDFLQFADLENYFATRYRDSVAPRELLRHAARSWYSWLHPDPATLPAGQIPFTTENAVGDKQETSAEDLETLKRSLERDLGGLHVDLSQYPSSSEKAPSAVVPLPAEKDIPWQGSFLMMDETDISAAVPPRASHPEPGQTPVNPLPPANFPSPSASTSTTDKDKNKDSTSSSSASSSSSSEKLKRLGEMITKLQASAQQGQQQGTSANLILTSANLRDVFEQMRHSATHLSPSQFWMRDLIRLAGENSALIRLDFIELPGLSSQRLPRWTWSGSEVIFAIALMEQPQDWRLLASYMAGRLAEFTSASAQYGEPIPDFKWMVLLQNENEAKQLHQHLENGTIPQILQSYLDVVQFSEPQLTDMKAIWQLSQHPELTLDATLTQPWQSLLADRMDFFWRRLTRPLKAAAA